MRYDVLVIPSSINGVIYITDPEFLEQALHPDLEALQQRDELFARWEQELGSVTILSNGDIVMEIPNIE